MGKIIFLDVDGTLIDYEAKLPASAAKAVDMARANGHKVYICTGCSKAEVLQRNLCDLDGHSHRQSKSYILYRAPAPW